VDAGSYSCAVKGHEELRSPSVCVFDQNSCWSVSYSTQTICALSGSSVDIHSYYTLPDQLPDPQPAWYIRLLPQDKELSPADGRVEFFSDRVNMNTLRLKHLTDSDSAEYLLRFKAHYWNPTHSSAGVSLSVTGLQVKVEPVPVTVSEEQTVTLMCSSTCTLPNNPTYIWYKNGQTVIHCKSASCSVDVVSGEVSYSCAVEGHENISSPPVYSPKNTTAVIISSGERVEGDSVTLSCSSDANPPVLIYSWFKQRSAADAPLTTGQNYNITNISSQHSGLYYCTAHNQLGQHNSTPTHLHVLRAEGPEESSVLKLVTVGVSVFLALILITAALWMWRKKVHSSAEESEQRDAAAVYDNVSAQPSQPANRDDQDDIHYSSVYFRPSHSQEEPPFLTAKLPLDSTEEEDVQYAAVNFSRRTAAPQSPLAEVADDPSQIYSQIQKHKPAT
ncbi:B-cell receptor CD22-like, partial [Colossoma macropomum]|uniref:B-cell receptor CD22-like n=1 Tax=Colossoma macropomum TaxID=42526 RepID=UPI001864364F